jgi:hypothetical protein
MIQNSRFKFQKQGFGLVDVLVGTFLATVIFLGVIATFQLGIKIIAQSQNKITATAIANQEIEKVRNLGYEKVGTVGAVLPFAAGSLEGTKILRRNAVDYTVETRVKYMVDSADGIGEPEDSCPNDYKKMKVKVSWSGLFGSEVVLTTDVFPENLIEECATSGGILSVLVFDAYGEMVLSSMIEVFNSQTGVRLDFATLAEGKYYFPFAAGEYKVAASKDGYSQSRTYGTDEITFPEKPHPIIVEGWATEIGLSIDRTSSLSVSTLSLVGEEYVAAPNVEFSLRGTKIIGKDASELPVYKYSRTFRTNSEGQVTLSALEWDSYVFSINPATGLDLVGTNPSSQPINLSPNTSSSVDLYVEADNSLLLIVQDQVTLEPVFSASARLYKTGYDVIQYTNATGQTYFIPLQQTTYNLQVTAAGYSSFSGTVSVIGDTALTIQLEQIE